MLCAVPVVEFKDTKMGILGQGLHHAFHIQFHGIFYLPDDDDQHGNQAKCLKRVRPDNSFDSTPVGV